LEINIISFDIPYPPDYGGVIDVFYKVKTLSELGVKVHLHCYEYHRKQNSELENYCESVTYYKRSLGFKYQLSKLPYIVNTRISDDLLQNLLKNDFPILFEGLHTTFFLNNVELKNRLKIIRTHNVEHEYYSNLIKSQNIFNLKKRLYFWLETIRLKRYESILSKANLIFPISLNDTKYFSQRFENVHYIPPFHQNNSVNSKIGAGNYILFHGNLSVGENYTACIYLIENALRNIKKRIIIAGKNPNQKLIQLINKYEHIQLKPNPTETEMQQLVADAHIHLLFTFQPTGIKLKLINSLCNGRHCIANSSMVENTGLEKLCVVENDSNKVENIINDLWDKPFDNQMFADRKNILNSKFSNQKSAEKIIELIRKY